MGTKERETFEKGSRQMSKRDSLLWKELRGSFTTPEEPRKVFLLGQWFGPFEEAEMKAADPGPDLAGYETASWRHKVSQQIQSFHPDLLLVLFPGDCTKQLSETASEWLQDLLSQSEMCVCVLDEVGSVRWKDLEGLERDDSKSFELYYARGDLCIGTSNQGLGETLSVWASQDHSRYYAPISIDTIHTHEGFSRLIVDVLEETLHDHDLHVAFPVEALIEDHMELGTLDTVPLGEDVEGLDLNFVDPMQDHEDDLLDTLPLAGFPKDEAERRREWAKVPRKVRIAIRRLHNMMSHKPKEVLLQVLRGSGASDDMIRAAKAFRCPTCAVSQEIPKTHPVSAPPSYVFNKEVSIDVFEVQDSDRTKYQFLNMICVGTCYQVVALVRVGEGQPTSAQCLKKFQRHWVQWAGWPESVSTDRGLHNRGAFATGLSQHGVVLRQAGLESPEHIGRCERHGGIIKRAYRRVCRQHHLQGKEQVKAAMTECQVAKNEFVRHGGFSPSQWVLGRQPRGIGHLLDEDELGQLGVLSGAMDPSTAFGRSIEYRHTARRAYVQADTSRRARAAVLRKSGPLPGKYSAGDLVCYRIERDSSGVPSWSGVSRIIGFDGKTVWVTHRGVPVATSLGKLRPCTSAEVLAYQILSKGNLQYEHLESEREQQRFVDARAHDSDADDEEDSDSARPSSAIRSNPLEGLRTVRRRVGLTPEESRAEPRVEPTIEEPEVEDAQQMDEPTVEAVAENDPQLDAADIPVPEEEDTADALLAQFKIPTYGSKECNKYRAFVADRIDSESARKWLKKRSSYSNKKKAAQNKVFTYEKCSPELQKGIDGSRKVEWDKWKEFNAALDLDEEQYQKLKDEGHEEVPLKWVDTDKNDALRGTQPDIEVRHKSRLVTRGDLESGDIRSDSPTADIEAQNLIFSFAASRKVRIGSADITNAYFQGEELDRVLILRQPKGGLPGEPPERRFLARVPVYGTHDGGRKFWKRLKTSAQKRGFLENAIFKALYVLRNNEGRIIALLCTHVDDLLWAAEPEAEPVIEELLKEFSCGKVERKTFRYCGKEVSQADDYTITVTCKETTLKVRRIFIAPKRKPGEPLTDKDKLQLKSVAGSLSWVARQCRPDLAYRVSRMQSASAGGIVADLREANKAVDYALATPDRGLTFRANVLDWDNLISCVITDASHANESQVMKVKGEDSVEPYRSQGARLNALGTPSLISSDEGHMHLISYASRKVRRVCRSTLQAEAYTLQAGVEEGDRLRAAVADLFGKLDRKKWEASSAAFMRQVWFTDCRSLSDTLRNPKMSKHEDKRLSIEIASMRESLWRAKGEQYGDPYYQDDRPEEPTDEVRWIDTDVMVADPLTKVMESTKLVECLFTNCLKVEQPIESVIKKRAKQLQRRKTADPADGLDVMD